MNTNEVTNDRGVAVGDIAEGTGVNNVWSRLGLRASRMMTVIAPAALSCSAVTGSPERVNPTTMRPNRSRMSRSEVERAKMAMTSEAAVMSKPL